MPASQSSHGAALRPGAARQLAAVALLLALTLPSPAAAVRSLSDWVGDAMITHFGGAQDGEEKAGARNGEGVAAAAHGSSPDSGGGNYHATFRGRTTAVGSHPPLPPSPHSTFTGMDPSSPSFGTQKGSCGYGVIRKDQVGAGQRGPAPGVAERLKRAARAQPPSATQALTPPSPLPPSPSWVLQYPYFSTAAFAPSNPFYQADDLNACGQCFQVGGWDVPGWAGWWVREGWGGYRVHQSLS